ncbi:MAG: NADH-quinone oxidoreductase subunit NuoH [Herpetosiphonaceae bacterium]|nr:NADH-quinone oxidoreductase subunit NuoH [Herpetosiphonaceae bacterium]
MVETFQQTFGAPLWLAVVLASGLKVTLILVGGSLGMMFLTWYERRAIAYMQDRRGPNRVGPQGSLQPIAEAIKTMTKEDTTPLEADRVVHFLAPVVMLAATVLTFAIIPWGNLFPSDLSVGVLFFVAIGGLHTLGMLMAGWGSNNKFALLGGMRGVAQMVSYEIPQVMAVIPIVLMTGTMSMQRIVESQSGFGGLGWNVFTPVGFFAFALFFVASLAEGERTPFDIPEADSEIVAGYMTEYTGMKFAVFYLANYMTNLAICFITASIFLGGGNGPGVNELGGFLGGFLSLIYFFIKALFLFFIMVLIRATVPRLRVDQLMGFAWKFLLPLVLVNILSSALWVAIIRWDQQAQIFTQWFGAPGTADAPNFVRLGVAVAVTIMINLGALVMVMGLNNRASQARMHTTDEELALGL